MLIVQDLISGISDDLIRGILRGFDPNSIAGLYFSSSLQSGNRLLSTTGTDTRLLKDRFVNHLDGSTEYGEVPDNTDLDITDNLTVIVRAKNDNSSLSNHNFMFGKYDTGDDEREWALAFNPDEEFGIFFGSSSGTFFGSYVTDSAVDLENIKTYGVTFSGGTVKVYLDGIEQAASGSAPSSINNETAPLSIGAVLSSGAVTDPWDGHIYEAIILAGDSGVPTDEQILSIHEGLRANPSVNAHIAIYGISGQTVAAHYKLDENTGSTLFDSSGNGNDGTWQNSPTVETTTQDVMSWQNQVGYTDNSGLSVPRNESNIINDVQGNPLGNVGKAKSYAYVEGNNCIDLDGSTEFGVITNTTDYSTSNWVLEISVDADAIAGNQEIFRQNGAGTPRAWIRKTSDTQLVTFIGDGSKIFTNNFDTTSPHILRLEYDFDNLELKTYLDDVLENTYSSITMEAATGDFSVGATDGGVLPYNGQLWACSLLDETVAVYLTTDSFGPVPYWTKLLRFLIVLFQKALAMPLTTFQAMTII